MTEIKSIAIIGAGALGLLYMEGFNKSGEETIFFLSDPRRDKQLKKQIFRINGKEVNFPSRNATELSSPPELVLLSVKNHHLESTASLLQEICGPETIVMSVLNGIGSETYLESILPVSTILYTVVLGMDAVKEDNCLTYSRRGKFILGTKDNSRSPKLELVKVFLEKSGFDCVIPEDIHREIWYKWMINIGINQPSALLGATYKYFQKEGEARELMNEAMKETITVAEASGINLHEGDLHRWYQVLSTLGPEGKTSMLQDVEAGRKTEVESFSGALIQMARSRGIAVPVNQTLNRLLTVKEDIYLNR